VDVWCPRLPVFARFLPTLRDTVGKLGREYF
jgi:hypothetical protein